MKVANLGGLFTTSSVIVTVAQTLTAIAVDPASLSLVDNATQSFMATAADQFGQALASQPAFTWSVDPGGAGGAVNSAGLYTAPTSNTGSDTVRAASGSISGTSGVSVTALSSRPYAPAINWAAAQSSTSVALAWTNAPGEAGFLVERSTIGGSTWTTAGTVAAGVTTFTDTGLTEATSYTYQVLATNALGDSSPSATQTVVTPPAAPTGLSAVVASAGQINLAWTDHSTAAAYYVIQQSPNGSTGWVQVGIVYGSAANSDTATGPFGGSTTYYFSVYAYAYTGGSSAYLTATATTPAFPGQPAISSATAQSGTTITLTWTDVPGETGFLIQRSTYGGSTWATAGTVGAGVTSFTDTGLTEATSYSYRVTATNAAGNSAPSATQSVATQPAAPTGLAATVVSAAQVNLSWTDHTTAAYDYVIEQSTDGVNWIQVGTAYGSTATSYTATGPFNGATTYDFRVQAYAFTGGGSAYATASASTPSFPNQPTLTSATAQSDTTVALSWTDLPGEAGFLIQRSTNGGSTWATAGTVGAGVTSFTDTGLTEATSYSYRVTATNAVGNSAPSATQSVTTLPSAPTGLTAAVVSGGQINLTWTDHSTAASYYYVEQSPNGSTGWTQLAQLYGSGTTSYAATGPFAASTTYYFRVNAYAYTGGNSLYATASATTPAFPAQPAFSSVPALSDTSVSLTWADVAGEAGFLIQRSANGGSTWATAGTVGAGVTSFTDTGLTEATSYSYRVTATNAAGNSAPSAAQSVATLPSAPTGLTATVVSGGQINLTWTDHSTAASYYYVEQSPNGSTGWSADSASSTARGRPATRRRGRSPLRRPTTSA